jgi:hypothetical protein
MLLTPDFTLMAPWFGLTLCVLCGLALIAGGPGGSEKMCGLLLGLFMALLSAPIGIWVQSL